MKTAKEYLAAQMAGHPGAPFLSYSDALAAVQAVLTELDALRDAVQDAQVSCQVMEGKPLADERAEYRRLGRNEMRARLLTLLPRAATPLAQANVFPPACPLCLQRGAECLCWLPSARLVPTNPNEEQPPF